MTVEIKPIKMTDIFDLVRVCNQSFIEYARYPEAAAEVVNRLKNRDSEWLFGAYKNNVLKGFLLGRHRPGDGHSSIRLIGVDPSLKGKGVGSRLIRAMEERNAEKGVDKIRVGTPFAKTFYEKNGFTCIRVSLKVIRDLAGSTVEQPRDVRIRTMDFSDAEAFTRRLSDRATAANFLTVYLKHFRRHSGSFWIIEDPWSKQGVVLSRELHHNHDFAETLFFHTDTDPFLPTLVRAYEYQISKKGLRYIGFKLPADREELFADLGYTRAEEDYFWTMYTLEKQVGKGDNG